MRWTRTTSRGLGTSGEDVTVYPSVIASSKFAFQGLLRHINERFFSKEFESLSHLSQIMSCVDVGAPTPTRATFQKEVNFVGASSNSEEKAEIGLAEWSKKKKSRFHALSPRR